MSHNNNITPGRGIFLGVAVFLLFFGAYVQMKTGNVGDKGWLLLAARMWLQGKQLYIDIFEVNPPLIVWLYAIPARIALHVKWMEDDQIMTLLWIVSSLFIAGICTYLIRFHSGFTGDIRKQTDFAFFVVGLFIFFTPPVYFSDRENIIFVLTFPYLLRFMPRLARQALPLQLRILIGGVAAVGFCIKPYTLLIFIAIQLLYIIRERTLAILFSLENCIIYTGGILYMLSILLFTPEYLSVVVPMALQTYHGYNHRENSLLYFAFAFISLGVTFADFRPRYTTPYRRDVYYFVGVSVSLVLYALANNGWGYTFNPLLCLLLFISGWMIWDYDWLKKEALSEGRSAKQFIFGIRACTINITFNTFYIIVCFVACLGFSFTNILCQTFIECGEDEPYWNYVREHHSHNFAAFSMNFHKWPVLVNVTGAQWDTRFNHLWMLPSLLNGDAAFVKKNHWILEYVGRGYAEDLNERKPDIAFVDTSYGITGYPHPIDMPAYFSQVPEFKKAWQKYRYDTTIDQCAKEEKVPERIAKQEQMETRMNCRFAIYRRVTEKSGEED